MASCAGNPGGGKSKRSPSCSPERPSLSSEEKTGSSGTSAASEVKRTESAVESPAEASASSTPGPSECSDVQNEYLCEGPSTDTSKANSTNTHDILRTSHESINKERAVAKRKSRTLTFRKKKSDKAKEGGKKRSRFWTFRLRKHFPVRLRHPKDHGLPEPNVSPLDPGSCVCTGYRRTEDHVLGAGVVFSAKTSLPTPLNAGASPIQAGALRQHRLSMGAGPGPSDLPPWNVIIPAPPQPNLPNNVLEMDLGSLNIEDFPCEDIDELRIAQRARDMERGIDLPPGHQSSGTYPHLRYSSSTSSSSTSSSGSSNINDALWSNLASNFNSQCVITAPAIFPSIEGMRPPTGTAVAVPNAESLVESQNLSEYGAAAAAVTNAPVPYIPRTVHTQIDYIHCLVPDLKQITNCSFYWGVMDRYEAERHLDNRPEGTFLLRDSAQEEFLFSVSFRRYGRSLHARIEQWNHKFSFDSHDPGVFAADTVCGLIEHYKDPSWCMFFEPLLTIPLNRTYPFSLQHLCRTVICGMTTYDGVNILPLPKPMKEYLKYYHYKQKVRVRRFDPLTTNVQVVF